FLYALRPPRRPTLFPYTTLFRSSRSRIRRCEPVFGSVPSATVCCATTSGLVAASSDEIGFAFRMAIAASIWARLVVFQWRELLRSEEHTSELQSPCNLVCRLLLE